MVDVPVRMELVVQIPVYLMGGRGQMVVAELQVGPPGVIVLPERMEIRVLRVRRIMAVTVVGRTKEERPELRHRPVVVAAAVVPGGAAAAAAAAEVVVAITTSPVVMRADLGAVAAAECCWRRHQVVHISLTVYKV